MSDWPFNPNAIPQGLPPSRVLDLDNADSEVGAIDPRSTVILLLSAAADREWSARAVTRLSAIWASRGRRIVLADLHLEDPLLGNGGDELEGIVDVLLYGASLSRIATPGSEGAYYLIPAGTYTPDPAEIYRHPRWRKLAAGFRDTQATLLLFVPIESADLDALSGFASEAILFGSIADSAEIESELTSHGVKALAVLTPTAAAAALYARAQPTAAPSPVTSAEVARTPSHGSDGDEVDGLDLPPPKRRRADARSGSQFILLALLLVVVLIAIFYVVVRLRPELSTPESESAVAAQAMAIRGANASREGDLLNYSVNVKAFPSLSAAVEQLADEQRRFPTATFFISPEEIQGVVYFKILAGLTSDSLSAMRLRDRLVQEGSIEPADNAGSWNVVQATPLAFDLGEFASRDEATRAADSLLTLGIPTYPVITPYSDGSTAWQLYAGAYRSDYNAQQMGRMLAAAGLPATIRPRTGTTAAISE